MFIKKRHIVRFILLLFITVQLGFAPAVLKLQHQPAQCSIDMSKVSQVKKPCCEMDMQHKMENNSTMKHCKGDVQSKPGINVPHQCCFSSTTDNIYEEYTVVKVPEINKLTATNNISYQIDSNNFISSNDFQVKDYQINSPPIFLIDSSFII